MMERSPEKSSSPASQRSSHDSEASDTPECPQSPSEPSPEHQQSADPPLPNKDAPTLPNNTAPPLPDEPPPLPNEVPPTEPADDGWEPVWDDRAQGFYFYNRFTNKTQWENPRVPEAAPGKGRHDRSDDLEDSTTAVAGGYNPAVHGDYDPNADYAKPDAKPSEADASTGVPGAATDPASNYAATGTFNRFTGKWQNADFTPERFTDEQKSKRQMNAFFDVDAAANTHDGRSLRAERASKKLSKAELKAFKEKRRDRKEEKRRAWLRD